MPAENGGPVVGQSFLVWFVQTLGLRGLLVALVALMAFALTRQIVRRGRGTTAVVALLLIVPLPVLASMLCELSAIIASFHVITTTNAELKASELYGGISETLVMLFFGLLSMAPSYVLAMVFLYRQAVSIRSIQECNSTVASGDQASPNSSVPQRGIAT